MSSPTALCDEYYQKSDYDTRTCSPRINGPRHATNSVALSFFRIVSIRSVVQRDRCGPNLSRQSLASGSYVRLGRSAVIMFVLRSAEEAFEKENQLNSECAN